MGVDKEGSKSSGSGLFSLFDWNKKKSRKKSFSLRNDLSEGGISENRDFLESNDHPFDPEDGTDSCSSMPYLEEIEHRGQSPPSLLDNSFSYGSCVSESWKCGTGSKHYCSSTLSSDTVDSNLMKKILPLEQQSRWSDVQTRDDALAGEFCQEFHHKHSSILEVDYVREILINRELLFGNFILSPMVSFRVIPPVIFDKLEESTSFITANEEEENGCRISRKKLCDSVNECLDMKSTLYFQSGYRAWAKGIAVIKEDMAEDIYKEISGWTSYGDWMVDEIVEKDMSTLMGRWNNFEIESFEAGIEIENEILDWLIDEIVAT